MSNLRGELFLFYTPKDLNVISGLSQGFRGNEGEGWVEKDGGTRRVKSASGESRWVGAQGG